MTKNYLKQCDHIYIWEFVGRQSCFVEENQQNCKTMIKEFLTKTMNSDCEKKKKRERESNNVLYEDNINYLS